tara:strand:- start:16665 stop:19403 length:2739 start_codon:yes stop_codon:yes gene_type:complete
MSNKSCSAILKSTVVCSKPVASPVYNSCAVHSPSSVEEVTWKIVHELVGDDFFKASKFDVAKIMNRKFDAVKLLTHKKAPVVDVMDVLLKVSAKYGYKAVCEDFYSAEYHALLGWVAHHRFRISAKDLSDIILRKKHWLTQCMLDIPIRIKDCNLLAILCGSDAQRELLKEPDYTHVMTFVSVCENRYESQCHGLEMRSIKSTIWNPVVTEATLNSDVFVERSFQKRIDPDLCAGRIHSLLKSTGLKESKLMDYNKDQKGAYLVLAGGCVSAATLDEDTYQKIAFPQDHELKTAPTDLDFFVVGDSDEEKREFMKTVLTHFVDVKGCTLKGYGSVIQIHGLDREAQIILSECDSAEQLIAGFDSSHIQCYVQFGRRIRVSPLFNILSPLNTSCLTKQKITGYRLMKMMRRGYTPVAGRSVHTIDRHSGNWFSAEAPLDITSRDDVKETFEEYLARKAKNLGVEEDQIMCDEQVQMIESMYNNISHCVNRVKLDDEKSPASFYMYEKNKLTKWKNMDLEDAKLLVDDMRSLGEGMANYEKAGRYAPWVSDDKEDPTDNYLYNNLMLRDCHFVKYNSFDHSKTCCKCYNTKKTNCTEEFCTTKSRQNLVTIEGTVLLNPSNNKDDPLMKEKILEKFVKEDIRIADKTKSLLQRYNGELIDIQEKLSELISAKKPNKKSIENLNDRKTTLIGAVTNVYKMENRYNPKTIKMRDLSDIAFMLDSITREDLYESSNENKQLIGLSELPILLASRMKGDSYSTRDGKTVKANATSVRVQTEITMNQYNNILVSACDGRKFNMTDFVYNTESRFNITVSIPNYSRWYLAPHTNAETVVTRWSIENMNIYAAEYVAKSSVRDKFKQMSVKAAAKWMAKLYESPEFIRFLNTKMCTKPHRDANCIGQLPKFTMESVYLISE